jgi:hypothetical protein
MSKYYLVVNDGKTGDIVFEGQFVVNSNIVVEMYETINGVTSTTNIINSATMIPNNYVSSWEQFDFVGIILYSSVNLQGPIQMHANMIGDELITNIGTIEYGLEGDRTAMSVSYTITPFSVPVPVPVPISNICFQKGTPILTDQGVIPIEQLTESHTIDEKKIVGITQTTTTDNYLVCFKKNALRINMPSKNTIMSQNHKISYQGNLIKAKDFLDIYEHVVKLPYKGETLYNVLMKDHYKMNVNNLICETLNPTSEMAKLYTYITLHPKYMKTIIEKYNKEYMKRKQPKLIFN